jgi:hypothetical protein
VQYYYSIIYCRTDGGLVEQLRPCENEQNFVCTLPEECHADVCMSHCTPKTINLCEPPPEKKVTNNF